MNRSDQTSPFVYAAALQEGISPPDSLRDEEVQYVAPRTNKRWSPGNFGEETGRKLAVRDGLALSKNTITAQLILEVGPQDVAGIAHRMGIESEFNEVPSLALGTSEVTLFEMVAAYGTIAEMGTYHQPVAVTHIETADGRKLASFSTDTRQAVRPELAYELLNMIRGVIDYGTGVRIGSQYDAAAADLAGKTGTTQRGADGWFMLLHPDLVMGSWVGFPSPAITFRTRYWGQGSHNALRIVGDFYTSAALSSSAQFQAPPGYVPPEERMLRATDTSGFALPDFATDTTKAYRDSILAASEAEDAPSRFEGREESEDSLFEDGVFASDEEPFEDREGAGFAEDDAGGWAEDEGDDFDEDADDRFAEEEGEPQEGDESEEEAAREAPQDESTAEADRLNRQERENSDVDEALEALEERDNR